MGNGESKPKKPLQTKASLHAPPVPDQKQEMIEFIAQMAAEMATMTMAAGFPFLTHFLKMAEAEARAELAAKPRR